MSNPNDVRRYAEKMYGDDAASKALGITVEVSGPGNAVAVVDVTETMLNGFFVCHGGHIFTLADTAFAFACNTYGVVTLAAGASIEFLTPARLGDRLTATAIERYHGGRIGIYDVTVTNQDGVDVAVFRGRSHATHRSMLEDDTHM